MKAMADSEADGHRRYLFPEQYVSSVRCMCLDADTANARRTMIGLNATVMEAHEATASGLGLLFKRATKSGKQYIGLAGAYDQDGALEFLSLSSDTQVLSIRLSPTPETILSSKRKPEIIKAGLRKVLNQKLAEGATHKFLAFDADRIAIGLFLEFDVRIKGLIHLPSLRPLEYKNTDSFNANFSLFKSGGFTLDDREDLRASLDYTYFGEDFMKRLHFRASSASYMQNLHKDELVDSTLLDTSTLSREVSREVGPPV